MKKWGATVDDFIADIAVDGNGWQKPANGLFAHRLRCAQTRLRRADRWIVLNCLFNRFFQRKGTTMRGTEEHQWHGESKFYNPTTHHITAAAQNSSRSSPYKTRACATSLVLQNYGSY